MIAVDESLEPAIVGQTPSPTSTAARLPGALTYMGNRVLMTTRAKPAGTLRIAVIGDSMAYGAGVPYRKTLAARLASHLNAAVPEWWVECVSFGASGACLHHAAGRALTHALPADADVVIMAVCCNDAFLLGPQPSDLAVLGSQWVTYRPLVRRSLTAFKQAVSGQGRRAMVVYLDMLRQAGEVCVPDALASVCAEVGLPFLDGSSVLTGYQAKDLIVPADGHLNGLAYDVIARHMAQSLVSQQWLPPSTGFDDGTWIEGIERGGRAREDAGLAGVLAYGEALGVLEAKWLHRRNTKRRQHDAVYTAARDRLREAQRLCLARMAHTSFQERLRLKQPVIEIWQVEMWANQLMALSFALEHLIETGADDGVLANLGHLREEETAPAAGAMSRVELPASIARWQRIRDGAGAALRTLREASADYRASTIDPGQIDYLTLWNSRHSHWLQVLEQCAERFLALLPQLAPSLDAGGAMLLAYLDRRAPLLLERLADVSAMAGEMQATPRDAARAAGASHMVLDLVMSAVPGPEVWIFIAGMESAFPAFSERHVGTGYFIRDGEPHVYEIELPVALSGKIYLYVEGQGLRARGDGIRIHRAQIRWPHADIPPVTLPPPVLEEPTDNSSSLVFRAASTLPRVAPPIQ